MMGEIVSECLVFTNMMAPKVAVDPINSSNGILIVSFNAILRVI